MFSSKKISVKIVSSSLLMFILFSGVVYASNSSKIDVIFEDLKYIFNGEAKQTDSELRGFLYKNTTYVPLRFIAESLGQDVKWDQTSKTITLADRQVNATNEQLKSELEVAKLEIERLKAQLAAGDIQIKDNDQAIGVDGLITFTHGNLKLNFTDAAYKKYSYLQNEYTTLTKELKAYFGINDTKQPVTMYIQTKQDRTAYPNEGSFYESGQKIIVLNPDELFEMFGSDSVRFVFIHEIAHAYQDARWGFDKLGQATGYKVNWILEGQADFVAKKLAAYSQYGEHSDPSGMDRDAQYYYDELHLRNGANGWSKLDWSSIHTFADLGVYQDEYFAFESIIHFIEANYSRTHHLKFIDYVSAGNDIAEALQKAFDKSDVELMKEYKQYYKLN